jgi:hypothetical protein
MQGQVNSEMQLASSVSGTESLSHSLSQLTVTVSASKLNSSAVYHAIEHVEYMGVIPLIEGYEPERTCREHMLRDLPGVLHSPRGTLACKIPLIVEECARIAEDRLQRLPEGWKKLPPSEALAVVSYTYDLNMLSEEDGDDNLFVVLNDTLRKRNASIMRVLKPYLTYLMRGLRALPEVQGTCFRGVPLACLNVVQAKYILGSDVHWSAFTSCALDINVAKHFAQQATLAGAQGEGGVIFRITVLSARDVHAYSAFPKENEVLLSPNVRLVVTAACRREHDGFYYVDLLERCGVGVVF